MSVEYRFNFFLRIFLQVYLEVCILCLLNIRYLKVRTTLQITSIGLSVFLLFLFQIWMYVYIKKYPSKICEKREDAFKNRDIASVAVLFEEYKFNKWSLFYNIFFALRRFIYALIIIFGYKFPMYQSFAFVAICFGKTLYQIIVRPFKYKMVNVFMIYNELTLVTLSGILFIFINPIKNSGQSMTLGWICILMVLAMLTLNLGYLFIEQIRQYILIIKRLFSVKQPAAQKSGRLGYEFSKNVANHADQHFARSNVSGATYDTSGFIRPASINQMG